MDSSGHDFADRPASLNVQVGGGGPQSIVTSATYLPSGPLKNLVLVNGLAESRTFDGRYSPTRIQVPGLLDWAYTTDRVGNPTAITQTVPSAELRTYGYQDFQYYLTSGAGPWPGPLSWTYDRIGNRLTETRGALTDTYTYRPNAGVTGRTAVLESIELGVLGMRDYTEVIRLRADQVGGMRREFGCFP